MNKTTMIIGASPKPDRYANKAQRLLEEYGHTTVSPTHETILGRAVFKSPSAFKGDLHTVTLYIRPIHLQPMLDEILSLHPKRVIFNPGTEDPKLERQVRDAGIEALEACTLVLLNTGQY